MKIGELAQRTGTATETIRFYEREGLLPPAPRSDGNYRLYGSSHQERLLLIRRCRALDMSLDEIKALLAVRDAPEASCEAVNALLTQHLGHVAELLAELTALQAELLALRERCTVPQRAGNCGILEGLGQASPGPVLRAPYRAGGHGAGKGSR